VRGLAVIDTGQLLSYLLAALAATGNAVGNVMQRKASLEESPDRPFGLAFLLDVIRRPVWILGFSGLVASFVLQAIALGLGELSAVEPIITLEVPLTVLVASRVFGGRIGRGEWTAIFVMTAGMILMIAALNPQPGDETHVDHVTYVLAGGGTAATIVALVLASRRGTQFWRTAFLGAAAGTSFGLTATMVKETATQFSERGVLGVVTTWQTYIAVGFGVLGVVIMQWALHTGPLLAAQPGFTLMDPLVSILWGVLVFNEMTRSGPWLVPATLGGVAVGAGVAMLARSPLLAQLNADSSGVAPRGGIELTQLG
jgi:drug/metabolite transporter (DMT)-like permease